MAEPKKPESTQTPPEKLAEPTRVRPGERESKDLFGDQTLKVALQPPDRSPTSDQILWTAIRNRTGAIGFGQYRAFIDRVLCQEVYSDNRLICQDQQDLLDAEGTQQTPYTSDSRLTSSERPVVKSRWRGELPAHFHGVDAYDLLKAATEAFLIIECGVAVKPPLKPNGDPNTKIELVDGEETRTGFTLTYVDAKDKLKDYLGQGKLPYLNRIVAALFPTAKSRVEGRPFCDGIMAHRLACPCLLELIWSFYIEESLLVQCVNAISLRFQNRRGPHERDPLAHLKLDPLRPLGNLIWGYIQDEHRRLTLARRAYEYDHHYGLTLVGKAVPQLRSVDSRSRFLEEFNNLLSACTVFFTADDDRTVKADAFPLLNALKEVHLLLAQGATNQFGDLPWTARVEMLIQQWLLARPEIREYLGASPMVPYQESWMGAVDTMKSIQGWSDVSVSHFRDLAVYSEQILLSIRYGDWIAINDPAQAANWARYWRPEIQSYIHSYRAVTGVDLAADVVDTRTAAIRVQQPSLLHQRRAQAQRSGVSVGGGDFDRSRGNGELARGERHLLG